MDVIISYITTSSPQYGQVWDLREEVLRRPIGLSLKDEDLSGDHQDTIFVAEEGNRVIACLMLHRVDTQELKLRQMAVHPSCQSRGVGRQLVLAAEDYATKAGFEQMVLHARKTATRFYENLGYRTTSDEFTEVGIPHFEMRKKLKK